MSQPPIDDGNNSLVLEADDGHFDFMETDSALGDEMSLLSSTASLRSSLMRPTDENGRQYHRYKEGRYVLPIDGQELARQEYQYSLCLATWGGYSFAPFTSLHRALDAGCGKGYWAIDFAEAHPECEVIGVDLSPIQEEYIPPNVQFEIDDLEAAWTFTFNFDYVHVMMMTGAFRDWPNFYKQAFQFLNSDGWVEIQDIDFPLKCDDRSLPECSALKQWSDLMVEAGQRSGFLLDTCGKAPEMMQAAGFVDIVRIPYKWPMGPWAKGEIQKNLGRWALGNFANGIETISLALFTRHMNWSKEKVERFAKEVEKDLQNPNFHTYFDLHVTYGRKP